MADNFTAKDSTGATITFSARDEGSSVLSPRSTPRIGGTDVSLTNPMPVTPGTGSTFTLAATESHLGEVGGKKVSVSVEFTRPADTTAYAANDVVSDSTSSTALMSFGNFSRVNAGTGYIVGARLTTDKKSVTPRFRVHLYNASNPTVSADNAAMKSLYADESKKIGTFDLSAMTTPADTTNSTESRTQDLANLRLPFACAAASRIVYALLETLDAFTPASGEKFTLTLLGELD